MNKLILANSLASLSSEGDFGHETLQEVAKTLAESLKQHPLADQRGKPAAPCVELAQLVHPSPRRPHSWSRRTSGFRTWIFLCRFAWANVETEGLEGQGSAGQFLATWCPPGRKEMPYLQSPYKKFKDKGFVVLAISDEDAKDKPFVRSRT
jgi:thiol-disulfide isomerase/thioredoxin